MRFEGGPPEERAALRLQCPSAAAVATTPHVYGPIMVQNGDISGLLFPDPIPPTGLRSWEQEVAWLNDLPPKIREELYDRLGRAESVIADQCLLATMDRMALVLLGVCRLGTLTAFVAASGFTRFHRIRPHAWKLQVGDVANPLHFARHGRFLIVTDLAPRNSLEEELAGRPIFLRHSQLVPALSISCPSRAQLRKSGERIIREHIDKKPQARMHRDDFIRAVMDDYPAVSRREALKIWAMIAPQSWRKPGRSRSPNS